MLIKYHTQRGFTLSELLIATVLGFFIILAAVSVFIAVFESNTNTLASQHLSQDLRQAMFIMGHDIERASLWGKAEQTAFPNADLTLSQASVGTATAVDAASSDIFASTGSDLVGLTLVGINGQATITAVDDNNTLTLNITKQFDDTTLKSSDWAIVNPFQLVFPTTNTPSDCILLTYDKDSDNTVDTNERVGYRLNGNTIQMYQSGTFACDDGVWEDITDSTTNVTGLQFTLDSYSVDIDAGGPGTSQIATRNVSVTINGQLASNANIARSFQSDYRVKNDVFIP